MNIYDVGIIGAGVAGTFATYRIIKEYKSTKTILFDLGRPPMKRRRQLEGFLGCLPNSDGKLYQTDIDKISHLVTSRKAKASAKWVNNILSNVSDLKLVKDKKPSSSVEKKLKKFDYELVLNDYIQLYPKDIHLLSKFVSDALDTSKNITCCFDNEIMKVSKHKNIFHVYTNEQEYKCKKLIVCTGRSGWRWANDLYTGFGIIEDNSTAKFGIRVEMPTALLKDFNKSNCTITKPNIEIGPFSWNGTVIPEDHVDLAISSYRSNENRWKTDKVSFNFIGNVPTDNYGFQQTDRIGKLTFVLSNDRILKEKVSMILTDKSKISVIPDYEWIKKDINDFSEIIPEILTKAYFHVPTITPLPPKINIGSNLETEVNGMFVAGENAGIMGIYAAACMGMICADSACK